jgi:F-type H+-transporting ATPase subunit delta
VAKSSSSAQISLRYAQALLRVADQAQSIPAVEQDMRDLLGMLTASPDLARAFASPLLGRRSLLNLVDALVTKAQLNSVTQKFLKVLAQNGRLSSAHSIFQNVLKICATRRGEVEAIVRTAHALSPEQQKTLKDTLQKSLGLQAHLQMTVDPTLLGGMMVTVGSQMIDDTVKSKLDRLKQTLQSNSNQNQSHKEVA